MNPTKEIQNLKEVIARLQSQIDDLSGQFFKNNFSSSQSFNKTCVFNDRLRVPVFDSAPTVAEIGDIFALANGDLFICTSTSPVTFTLVGSQT